MPLPSSTALTTLTGWDGLAVEQALIATSCGTASETALAGAIPSDAKAKAARPAVIVANLRLMSRLLRVSGQGLIALAWSRDGAEPRDPLFAPSQCGTARGIGRSRASPGFAAMGTIWRPSRSLTLLSTIRRPPRP